MERERIGRTIELTVGNKTQAARMLSPGVRTLYRRLKRYADGDLVGCEPATKLRAAKAQNP